jgi:hypothetical protein
VMVVVLVGMEVWVGEELVVRNWTYYILLRPLSLL